MSVPMNFAQLQQHRRQQLLQQQRDEEENATSFTANMRDLQARGKNPYQGQLGDSDEHSLMHLGLGQCLPRDTYEARERRAFAMSVLDSPEKLMMYAQSEGDSISSQRLRFMRMLCGLDPDSNINQLMKKKNAPDNGPKSNSSTPRKNQGPARMNTSSMRGRSG